MQNLRIIVQEPDFLLYAAESALRHGIAASGRHQFQRSRVLCQAGVAEAIAIVNGWGGSIQQGLDKRRERQQGVVGGSAVQLQIVQ